MISKTQITKRILKKRNPEIVETIMLAKKKGLLDLAKRLSGPSRLYSKVNLSELDKIDSDVVVVGKVLGSGEVLKKKKVAAINFSEQAKMKLKKSGCEIGRIKSFIKDKKNLEGVRVIW